MRQEEDRGSEAGKNETELDSGVDRTRDEEKYIPMRKVGISGRDE